MSQVKNSKASPTYWQSLEQLADTPEYRERSSQEFPGYNPGSFLNVSRRGFMKFMGGSLALAGLTLTGCRRWPEEHLAPYANNTGRIPGSTERYATVYEINGAGLGLLVTAIDGRPIKIEGNPDHPYSLGSTDMYAQAAVLDLYDPERSKFVKERTGAESGKLSSWPAFSGFAEKHFGELKKSGGAGLAFLIESTSSPTFQAQKDAVAAAFPQAQWFEYESLSTDNLAEGSKIASGSALRPLYELSGAKVIAAFGIDLLNGHPARVKHSRDWAAGRRSADNGAEAYMNRMYVADTGFTATGTSADVRLPVKPSRIPGLVKALAAKLGIAGVSAPSDLTGPETKFINALAEELGDKTNVGTGVVAVGPSQPAETHALALAINSTIGAIGKTVVLVDAGQNRPTHLASIISLAGAIKDGKVKSLVVIGGNPAYDAPSDLKFASLLSGVENSIHLSLYEDETSALCKWHLPRAHFLEAWGDARAWDGTTSVAQPLILPLYDGKSPIELLAMINGDSSAAGYELVKKTWKLDEPAWRQLLNDGLKKDSKFPASTPSINVGNVAAALKDAPASTGVEVAFVASSSTYDGRFANNAWLQEIPDPLTKVVWDNPALISKADADKLGVDYGDKIKITVNGASLVIAAYVLPGQPAGLITLPLGYGRTQVGSIGNGVGFNTYDLRTSTTIGSASGATIEKTGETYVLAATHDHHVVDSIGKWGVQVRQGLKGQSGQIVKEATFEEYTKPEGGNFAKEGRHGDIRLQLFTGTANTRDKEQPHAWGLSVDVSSCTGCNACVIACQAENNIPVVGKEEVFNHREMHWLRIDRYFKGDTKLADPAEDPNPAVINQPMMCQQCENAPCEQVCPVAATVHDTQGLNTMVYNRCIGTRYCSNNCPYKVRRFNYLDYHSRSPRQTATKVFGIAAGNQGNTWLNIPDQQQLESIDKVKQMVFNPEVTVRMRGVMEKCMYCVQRIHTTTIAKRAKGEALVDGDIVTACQQVCPTQAIVFGDLADPNSKVSKLRANQRSYEVLEQLNVRTRTRYLAKLRNPNEKALAAEGGA